MFRRIAILLSCLCSVTTAATAQDVCGVIGDAIHLEAQLVQAREPAHVVVPKIRTTAALLADLSNRSARQFNPAFLEIVETYTDSVAEIAQGEAAQNADAVKTLHASALHRVRVRYLIAHSNLQCAASGGEASNRAPGTTANPNASAVQNAATPLSLTTSLSATIAFLLSMALITYAVIRYRRKRALLVARHNCDLSVELLFLGGAFKTKAVDISAVGLKIEVPQGQDLPGSCTLNFEGHSLLGKIVWKNAHFAGVKLNTPLSLAFVRDHAGSRLERRRRNRNTAKASATSDAPASRQRVPG